MMLREALRQAAQRLAALSDTPRLDAELLMAHALGVDRNALLLHHLDDAVPDAFHALLARRLAHEPLAYIVGEREFWSLPIRVGLGVLIPRPDSETLIEAALDHFKQHQPVRILDLGTGPGTLLLAALSEWQEAQGLGVDISELALGFARANAGALRLDARASFRIGNWGEGLEGSFDLILCNPPYVEAGAALSPDVMQEPHGALFAGADGLDEYRRIAPQIPGLLSPRGCACIEIGHTQTKLVSALLEAAGLCVSLRQDLAGRDRCLIATHS